MRENLPSVCALVSLISARPPNHHRASPACGGKIAILCKPVAGIAHLRLRDRLPCPKLLQPLLGVTNDFSQSNTAAILYCWIAPAGSTCLGQTRVHSPTNVHPQTPSGWANIAVRSAAPWSRESML